MLQPQLSSRNNNLWLIRLLAAIMVIYGHCYPLANILAKNSHISDPILAPFLEYVGFNKGLSGQAVCIFFFISGLLIAKSAATQPWRRFWAARILRIYPALWVNLLFCVMLGYYVSGLDWRGFFLHHDTSHFILYNGTLFKAHFNLPNVFADLPWNSINGSLWTLPEEIRMYIYCFIISATGILKRQWLFNVFAIGFFACYLAIGEVPHIANPHIVNLPIYFLLGMACYVNSAYIRLNWLILLALIGSAFVTYNFLPRNYYDLSFAIALSYFILLISYKKHIKFLDFSHVGDFSYGVYLYGYPVQQLIIWLHDGVINPLLLFLLSMLALIPLAACSWFLIEKPALNLQKIRKN